jgi:hypothetical protein
VSVPKDMTAEESHERKLIKVQIVGLQIKLGLFDHPVPKPSSPKNYVGTETRDDYTKWNVSTEVSKKLLNDDLSRKYPNALIQDTHGSAEQPHI